MIDRKRHRAAAHAFTLIELLVVISIIALLIGILLPVLGKSRQAARAMGCLSNQRQLHVAISGYVQEYRRTYPQPDEDGDLSDTACATAVWFNAVDRYLNLPAKNYSKGVKAERNEHIGKQDPVWSSDIPTDKRNVSRSLKMNYRFGNPTNRSGYDKDLFTKESRVIQSALTVLMIDGHTQDVGATGTISSRFYASEGVVGLRHSNGANVLFVDGHAKNVKQAINMENDAPSWYGQDDPRQTLVWDFWAVRK